MGVARRIVPCLDVRGDAVVKGVRFRDHRVVGDILDLALRYRHSGADELVFYDITASPEGRIVRAGWVEEVAALLDIPFCVAGGIRSVSDAERTLNAGADKISLNSPALERPELIDDLAERFGSQCVVVGVDSRLVEGEWRVHQYTGDAAATTVTPRLTLDWVTEVQERGAGEIVLNCMGRDGTLGGYDIEQLGAVRRRCRVPLVASGGAGSARHFVDLFRLTEVDAALAASVFHDDTVPIPTLKATLRAAGIEVRHECC
jgi:cyclase